MKQAKFIGMVLLAALLVLGSTGMASKHGRNVSFFDDNIYTSDDISIDIDGGSVIITHEDENDEIEITDEYELYVNGQLIKTDDHQRELLEEYHTQVMEIKDYAIVIGKEGARVGIEGARVALKAIGGVVKMIFTDYDEDDLDRDMDRATEKIEAKAELLEEKAEKIEDMADDLEDMFYELEEEIPAIAKLDW